jgi:hypothetical protein
MNCKVCCKKFTSVNNLYKHLQTNKKCLVMTNKKRIHHSEPVNKEFSINIKLTSEEYNILMMYRSHRLQFEILPPDTDKNVETQVKTVVVPEVESVAQVESVTQVEEVAEVVAPQVEEVPEVVVPQVEEVPQVVVAQVEEVAEVVVSQVEDVPEVVVAQVEEVPEVVVPQVEEVAEVVVAQVEEVAEVVVSQVEEAPSDCQESY